ncbi:uncharacterized protein F5147DRAFT_200284 [Suillus discolor]|uniref:Uncharacterized protein n=1 Tax=Suillus discolor TaxID=1912936 RepID=A0A9P7F6K8_9AGAM|nr:uncharacterized protein F5147DRAFT_200284 [Suillus discolor]KAG2107637.1 hypothetical protein F5147DRAFT_200284 [Suillus discolor]
MCWCGWGFGIGAMLIYFRIFGLFSYIFSHFWSFCLYIFAFLVLLVSLSYPLKTDSLLTSSLYIFAFLVLLVSLFSPLPSSPLKTDSLLISRLYIFAFLVFSVSFFFP